MGASNGSSMVAPCENNSSIFEVPAILVIYGDCNQTEPIGINRSRCHTLSDGKGPVSLSVHRLVFCTDVPSAHIWW